MIPYLPRKSARAAVCDKSMRRVARALRILALAAAVARDMVRALRFGDFVPALTRQRLSGFVHWSKFGSCDISSAACVSPTVCKTASKSSSSQTASRASHPSASRSLSSISKTGTDRPSMVAAASRCEPVRAWYPSPRTLTSKGRPCQPSDCMDSKSLFGSALWGGWICFAAILVCVMPTMYKHPHDLSRAILARRDRIHRLHTTGIVVPGTCLPYGQKPKTALSWS